jgi:excisionase family DNA binding protein
MAQRASDRERMIRALETNQDPLAKDFAKANARADAAFRMGDATQYCGLGRTSIYDAIRAGKIETTTVGKRRLVFRESLDKSLTPKTNP